MHEGSEADTINNRRNLTSLSLNHKRSLARVGTQEADGAVVEDEGEDEVGDRVVAHHHFKPLSETLSEPLPSNLFLSVHLF